MFGFLIMLMSMLMIMMTIMMFTMMQLVKEIAELKEMSRGVETVSTPVSHVLNPFNDNPNYLRHRRNLDLDNMTPRRIDFDYNINNINIIEE